ncbi:MmcQ/YjbR family DNA-binding protein [Nocardioides jensenii]|uniref:MmcQ/YjbR family DNA-binding protein n=1 Tax=Nocardioides jensenii TaxID=1843 RepID=UPI00082FDC2D|nr:MmcQ/YjbR family DNA-binding protein [Nocardioides jensenii]
MDVEQMQAFALGLPGAWSDNPWGHEHPVIKVGPGERGQIFAFLGAGGVGVKCGADRDVADEWLHRYPDDASVMRYIGRSGWNDLAFNGAIPDDELLAAVEESYTTVVSKLPKKLRPDAQETDR